MSPPCLDEPCLAWTHTQSAVKLLRLKLNRASGPEQQQAIEDALAFIRLRSALKMAWHSGKDNALHRVGQAISDFEDASSLSRKKIRRLCRSIGFCLGDGQCYRSELRKTLRQNPGLCVSPKEAKTSEARYCLVMVR